MTGATRHLLGIALLGIALALPAAQQTRKQAEQDLNAVTERIQRLQQQEVRNAANREQLTRDLRKFERLAASARGSLHELREQRAQRVAARQKLAAQRTLLEAQRERHRQELAQQLRAAYFMGRNEPLKLLLNQRKVTEISRTLTYYGYFGRMRADQIAKLVKDVADIEEISAKLAEEDAELARLEQRQKAQVGDLEDSLDKRGQVMASLDQESQSNAARLKRAKQDRLDLEKLLKELSRSARSTPYDPKAPFARQQRMLAWPVAGRVVVDFNAVIGGTSAEPLRSSGIEIQVQRGAEVNAVFEGEVKYADWLGNRGLVVVIDHRNGYLSLYAHNEQLFVQKDSWVKAGERIATAGDTGGRSTPGLYFEIRSGGKPVNPHGWFRTKAPPVR